MQRNLSVLDQLLAAPVRTVLARGRLDGEGSLARQVYRLVRDLVIELRLLPNQFLSEKDVATSLAVSKTPVREAFIHLSEDGVVRVLPKSGTYVAPIEPIKAEEGFFAWTAMESSCAAQVAERRTFGDIAMLRGLADRLAASVDQGRLFYDAVGEFHRSLFDISDFPVARKLVDTAKFEVDRFRSVHKILGRALTSDALADVNNIVNAIARQDTEQARECTAALCGREREAMHALLDDKAMTEFFRLINRKKPGKRRPRLPRPEAV